VNGNFDEITPAQFSQFEGCDEETYEDICDNWERLCRPITKFRFWDGGMFDERIQNEEEFRMRYPITDIQP